MDNWERFKEFAISSEAKAEAELLEQNAVPAKVEVDEPIPGLIKAAYVLVPASLIHKAKWIMAQQQAFTEQELTDFALGNLDTEISDSNDNGKA